MTTITETAADLLKLQAKALSTLERLARDGHGPIFTQRSIGTGYTCLGIGDTTEDLCHAIIAIGKMATKGNRNDEKKDQQEAASNPTTA